MHFLSFMLCVIHKTGKRVFVLPLHSYPYFLGKGESGTQTGQILKKTALIKKVKKK